MKRYILCMLLALPAFGMQAQMVTDAESIRYNESRSDSIVVGIAWRSDKGSEGHNNVKTTLDDLGIRNVMLGEVFLDSLRYDGSQLLPCYLDENDVLKQEYADLVKSPHRQSNAAEVMKGIDAVIFTGGEDIAPTLFAQPVPWHGIAKEKNFNATRDISDYVLMCYCLDHDIPLMGICRGLQMLGVVSGTTMIQDIAAWLDDQSLDYRFEHRNEKTSPDVPRDYAAHEVNMVPGSIVAALFESDTLDRCPSWHHQVIGSVEGTALRVTATTIVSGIDMIEAVERTDKTLAIGIQFHPEAAYVKHLHHAANADQYMTKEQVITFFTNFVKAIRK